MQDLGLAALPNQNFFVQLDGSAYAITIRQASGCVIASVSRDDVTLIEGARVVTGTPLLPYRYEEAGNFILTTQNDDLPDYTQFGVTQFLTYLSADDLTALRA